MSENWNWIVRHPVLWAAMIGLLIPSPFLIAEEVTRLISRESLPMILGTISPDNRINQLSVQAAEAHSYSAGKLPDPSLTPGFERNLQSREYSISLGVSQEIPIRGKLRQMSIIAENATRRQIAHNQSEQFHKVIDGRKLLIQMAIAEQKIATQQKKILNLEKLLESKLDLVAVGEDSRISTGKLEYELAGSRFDLNTSKLEIDTLRYSLLSLIGLEESSISLQLPNIENLKNLPDPATFSLDQPLELKYHPQLVFLGSIAQLRESESKLEKLNRYADPKWMIGIASGLREDRPFGFERESSVSFEVSIPLPLWNNRRGTIEASESHYQSAELARNTLEVHLRNKASHLARLLQSHHRTITDLTQNTRPALSQRIQGLTEFREQGLATQEQIAQAEADAMNMDLNFLASLEKFHMAFIEWDAIIAPDKYYYQTHTSGKSTTP